MTVITHTIRKASDLHTHIRQGELLPFIAQLTAKNFANILAMPNTNPAKLTGPEAVAYRKEIEPHAPGTNILTTIKITPETTREMIKEAVDLNIKAGKLYFGITTNEAEGVKSIEPYLDAIRAMEEFGMILLIHGELAYGPDGKKIINLRREEAFIPIAKRIVEQFTQLKVVFEHITTAAMVDFVLHYHIADRGRIAATITVQHLRDDIDAVLGFTTPQGEGINPHNYCKPVLKMPEDRERLLWAATSGLSCFYFGSDSAPHTKETKECGCGKPGVFSALTRIETLAEIFEEAGKLDMLEGFLSIFGPQFYGLPIPEETITLVKEEWEIPAQYAGVVHYRQNEKIQWRIKE